MGKYGKIVLKGILVKMFGKSDCIMKISCVAQYKKLFITGF